MRAAKVYFKDYEAGVITEHDDGTYTFQYREAYVEGYYSRAVSLTLPKRKEKYVSPNLFAFFYHLLPEGANRAAICHKYKLDEKDDFGILLNSAHSDTIGAVTLKRI